MTDRRGRVLMIVVVVLLVAATLLFKVRIAVAGMKYLVVLLAIVLFVGFVTSRSSGK